VLLADDDVAGVEGGRVAGLATEHRDLTRGLPELGALLAGHGVAPGR